MRAITVSEHQPGIIGDHMAREVGRHGEIEPVAMGTVLGPFTVSLKVKKAGLDLHDPDVSTWRQAHHVGAPPIRKRKLGHHGMSKRAKRPANAALDLGSHRRLSPIERHDGVQVLREIDLWGTIDHESALHRHVHA